MNNRRNFIKNASIGTLAAISLPQIVSAAFANAEGKKVKLAKDDVVLFQGDSITDWGRDKNQTTPNNTSSLGSGYVLQCAAGLLLDNPDKNLKCFNKGISGNKAFQLIDRWQTDCLDLKPNIVSIMVGVNDYWHTITSGYKGTVDVYHADYRKLITQTKQALPGVSIIIGEPFGLKGVKAVDDTWYPTFDTYRQAARDIADEFGAAFIPYQAVFDKALELAPANYWSIDGVHPSVAGTALMAQAWLKAVKR
jgi:lysophospholipase L1-like esterase